MDIADAGFNDIMVGSELYRALDLNAEHFASPIQMSKVKEIAEFLNEHPDPLFVIGLTKYNKSTNMDNLEYLAGYARLHKEKNQLSQRLEQLNKDISYYGGN